MIAPGTSYRCRHCTQLLPFDAGGLVPDASLRRCQGESDRQPVEPTDPAVRARARRDGRVGADGLPAGP